MNKRKAETIMKTSRSTRFLSLMLAVLMLSLTAAVTACSPADKNDGYTDGGTSAPGGTQSPGADTPDMQQPAGHTGATPDSVAVDYTVTVSPLNQQTNNGGVFEGWGTSLCWWANRVGYSDTLAQKAADAFYGDDGLRMNIMRYNIGGGDDPSHKHITRTDSAVPGWLYPDGDGGYVYDYDADHNQLNVMQRCVTAAGENAIVEVFSNSPPYFMTNSGCSSGNFDAGQNNLKNDSYTAFAEYLAHVTNYIQNEMGITVASVAPMNEPNTNYWRAFSDKQEGCHFDAGSSQSKIITETAKALEAYDLGNVIISASDETDTGLQLNEYNQYSKAAKAVIGRINTHTYGTGNIAALGQLARDEGFVMWMSEVDGNGVAGNGAGQMGSALWFGEKIISDINALMPSGWVMWQVIDNHISKDGYNGNRDFGMVDVNNGFWGIAVADHDKEEIVLTQKYYGMGQFTRYIRPGYTLISCGSDALAAYDKATGTLVIVTINPNPKAQTVNFDLSQFEAVGTAAHVVRTSGRTNNLEKWAELDDIATYEGGLVAELKSNSITTFIIEGSKMGDISLEEIPLEGAKVDGSTPWNNGTVDVAANVIDGNIGTFFDGVADGWLEIDLGSTTAFDVIGYAPRGSYESRMVDGKFYGSDDGENWTELYTVTSTPASGINFAFMPEGCAYRYIRYDVPSGDYYCNIAEIILYKKGA